MSGTTSGGEKAKATNFRRYGKDFYKEIGRMGGRRKVAKGFAIFTQEKRQEAGSKGGKKSKRRANNVGSTERDF